MAHRPQEFKRDAYEPLPAEHESEVDEDDLDAEAVVAEAEAHDGASDAAPASGASSPHASVGVPGWLAAARDDSQSHEGESDHESESHPAESDHESESHPAESDHESESHPAESDHESESHPAESDHESESHPAESDHEADDTKSEAGSQASKSDGESKSASALVAAAPLAPKVFQAPSGGAGLELDLEPGEDEDDQTATDQGTIRYDLHPDYERRLGALQERGWNVDADAELGHPITRVRAKVGGPWNLPKDEQEELTKEKRLTDADWEATGTCDYKKSVVMHPSSQWMDFEHELDHVEQHEAMSQLLNKAFSESKETKDQERAVGSLLGLSSFHSSEELARRAKRIVHDQRWLDSDSHHMPTQWENLDIRDKKDPKRFGGDELTPSIPNAAAWATDAEMKAKEVKDKGRSPDGTAETISDAENKVFELHAYLREYQRQSDRQAPDARLAFQAHRLAENMPEGNMDAPLAVATIGQMESAEHAGADEKAPTIATRYQDYVARGGHAAETTPLTVLNSPQDESESKRLRDKALNKSVLPRWLSGEDKDKDGDADKDGAGKV